jgi:hypothetical protein
VRPRCVELLLATIGDGAASASAFSINPCGDDSARVRREWGLSAWRDIRRQVSIEHTAPLRDLPG